MRDRRLPERGIPTASAPGLRTDLRHTATGRLARLFDWKPFLVVVCLLPAAGLLLTFLTYPLGLGIWLAFTDATTGYAPSADRKPQATCAGYAKGAGGQEYLAPGEYDGPAGDRGGWLVYVEVEKELEDVPRPTQVRSGAAIFQDSPTSDRQLDVVGSDVTPDQVWFRVGRDYALEQQILRRIRNGR